MFCVCFFKQKTAYEMRISDWSSDVCSSDLADRAAGEGAHRSRADGPAPERRMAAGTVLHRGLFAGAAALEPLRGGRVSEGGRTGAGDDDGAPPLRGAFGNEPVFHRTRCASEVQLPYNQ